MLHWPEEGEIQEKKRFSTKKLRQIGIAAVSCIFLIVIMYFYIQSTSTISCIFPIGEVVFHNKWVEDGKMYGEISCRGDVLLGYDSYFAAPKVIEIASEEYYGAIFTGEVSYWIAIIRIEVSREDAYWDDLFIGDGKYPQINVEKILADATLIKRYCKITDVNAGE